MRQVCEFALAGAIALYTFDLSMEATPVTALKLQHKMDVAGVGNVESQAAAKGQGLGENSDLPLPLGWEQYTLDTVNNNLQLQTIRTEWSNAFGASPSEPNNDWKKQCVGLNMSDNDKVRECGPVYIKINIQMGKFWCSFDRPVYSDENGYRVTLKNKENQVYYYNFVWPNPTIKQSVLMLVRGEDWKNLTPKKKAIVTIKLMFLPVIVVVVGVILLSCMALRKGLFTNQTYI